MDSVCYIGMRCIYYFLSSDLMIELNPKSYESLVLNQKRGHMTIVFLKRSNGGDDEISKVFVNVMTVHARSVACVFLL